MSSELPQEPPRPEEVDENPELYSKVDDRVSLEQNTKKWIYEAKLPNDTFVEYEYDYDRHEWIERTAKSENKASEKRPRTDSDLDAEEEQNKLELKKLKKERLSKLKQEIARLKQERLEKSKQKQKEVNTAINVSNLPSDVTVEELNNTFSKFGLISQDFSTGEPLIKLKYEDDKFVGEATIIYVSRESVALSIEMLDDTHLRPNAAKIRVVESSATVQDSLTDQEKKSIQQANEKLKEKASIWDDDEQTSRFNEAKRKILDKIVVVDQMFRVEEMEKDPVLELDLKQDIQEECDKLGIGNDITKISFESNSGKVKIKFANVESSKKCRDNFNERYFDGLKLSAHLDGI